MNQQGNNEEELEDKTISEVFKSGLGVGKKVKDTIKDGIKSVAHKVEEEEILQEDAQYVETMQTTKDITRGSRGLIIAATVIGPFAGPMAVMFAVDMDQSVFTVIATVLFANVAASIVTAYINDLNLRSTSKNVARTTYYKFKSIFNVSEVTKEHNAEKITRLETENLEQKELLKELEKYKIREQVEKELKNK